MGRLGWVAMAAAALAIAGPAFAGDTVKVAQGTLHGATAGAVTSFKGVPFAAAPVGELRWKPPAPAPAWSGVREATKFGPACMQMSAPQPGRPLLEQSEDCLSLNVFTPASAKPGARLPVMVWIHGGAFILGTAGTPFYDGTHFAERGVVMVSVNYRLGRLGFFAHPALSAEGGPLGNYGVMDNIAALKWVQANVAQFGGEPGNVTIFGESAGGILVNVLMASPEARGLFHKAVSQSGLGRFNGMPIRGEGRTGEALGVAYATKAGITGSGPEAAKALRGLSAQQLSEPVSGLTDPAIPSPIVDGVLLEEGPEQAFAGGREAKVPYIAGGTSYEASLIPQAAQAPDFFLGRAGPLKDKLLAAYGGDKVVAANSLMTEEMMTEPNRHLARLHTKAGQKAWAYYFSYLPAAQRGKVPGLPHGGEISYVFGNLPKEPLALGQVTIPAATPEDRRVSEAAIARWVAFAKTGDPGGNWPQFGPSEAVLEFGIDGVNPRPNFHKESLDLVEQMAATTAGR
jgi:para-nitrobenzyl esterase